jgi:hypothetical protein
MRTTGSSITFGKGGTRTEWAILIFSALQLSWVQKNHYMPIRTLWITFAPSAANPAFTQAAYLLHKTDFDIFLIFN